MCAHGGAIQPAFTPPLTIHTRAASADKSHPRWRSTLTLTFSGLGFFEPSGLAQQPLSFSDRLTWTWRRGVAKWRRWTAEGRRQRERGSEAPTGRERAPSTLRGKSISQRFGFGTKGKMGNNIVKPSERSKGLQWDENARSDNSKVWLWD